MNAQDTTRAFSVAEAFRFGWDRTRENLRPILVVGLIGGFLAMLDQALTGGDRANAGTFLLDIPVQLARVGVTLVMLRVAFRLHQGRPVNVDELWTLTRGYVPFLLTSLLLGAIVAAGFILLIVPGVYLALMFGFATYFTADDGMEPVAALKASQRLTEGVKGELLVFGLAAMGVNLLGALALGIGLLVSIPTTFLASVYVFRALQARQSAMAAMPRNVGPLMPTT